MEAVKTEKGDFRGVKTLNFTKNVNTSCKKTVWGKGESTLIPQGSRLPPLKFTVEFLKKGVKKAGMSPDYKELYTTPLQTIRTRVYIGVPNARNNKKGVYRTVSKKFKSFKWKTPRGTSKTALSACEVPLYNREFCEFGGGYVGSTCNYKGKSCFFTPIFKKSTVNLEGGSLELVNITSGNGHRSRGFSMDYMDSGKEIVGFVLSRKSDE